MALLLFLRGKEQRTRSHGGGVGLRMGGCQAEPVARPAAQRQLRRQGEFQRQLCRQDKMLPFLLAFLDLFIFHSLCIWLRITIDPPKISVHPARAEERRASCPGERYGIV